MSAFDVYCELNGTLDGSLFCDEPMARHTSFRIGGPAALYVECATISDITRTFDVITAHNMPWTVVGKGSNLLVNDEGFDGAVITLGREFKNHTFPAPELGQSLLVAGGGMILSNLVQSAFKQGYAGFEFAVGIPGTLGGAVFMNAGSAESWIGTIVDSVTVLGPTTGLRRILGEELPWHYRSAGIPLGEVIVECSLHIEPGHVGQIRARMEALLNKRKKSQPLTVPSAGSVFRNPPSGSAGQMIEDIGLKGYTVGGAQVSEKHANFIVNNGTATAADVVEVIMHIRQRVKEEYGTELQPEVRFIGFASQA
jgi:UDP-N-acetylmuramate dehydrogenase